MDIFQIDSHKYAYHPQHSSTVVNYANLPNEANTQAYLNQSPIYVEVSPVGACNHRCSFCAVDYIGYKKLFLDLDAFVLNLPWMSANGTRSIMLAGEGEPLLHPSIADFVSHIKRSGIDVSFTSNGVMMGKEFVHKCISDISWLKISFNGGDPKTYSSIHNTSERDFFKVIDNVSYAASYIKRNNFDTVIGYQTLLLPDNVKSIHSLCKHARDSGARYLVVKPYSQHKFSNTKIYADIDYTEYLDLSESLKEYNTDYFSVVFRINTIKNWINQGSDRYCKCLATPATWAYVMADGELYSCSAYLLDPRFRLGNVQTSRFSEVWTSARRLEHSRFVLDELDISECRVNCRMDQVNRYLDSIVNKTVPHINFI